MGIKNALESLFINDNICAALIACIATCIGVYKINKQTSFKLLTIKRLKQLEEIRNIVLELRKLFEISYINKIKQNKQLQCNYQKSVNNLCSKFASSTSCYGLQEMFIKKELNTLTRITNEYICVAGCKGKIKKIIEQEEKLFLLFDMYTWSLWIYIQRLYKSDRNLTFRFDKIFASVYLRTYRLFSYKQFFKNYELKNLVNQSKRMRVILFWYRLCYKVI